MTARELTLEMLMQVNEGEKLSHHVIHRMLSVHTELSEDDRALATRLFYGTLERQLTLDWILERQTGRSMAGQKPKVRNLLRMGAYQLLFMQQIPPSAACNEAVNLIKKKGPSGLSGLINGVLRAIARNVESSGGTQNYLKLFAEDMTETEKLCFFYSMPVWLVSYWRKLYPLEVVQKMLAAFLEEQPTTIRLNTARWTMEELKQSLQKDGVTWEEARYAQNALRIRFRGSVQKLSAYRKGMCSVQDESSILAGEILPLEKDMFVLDVCGAPGGKALHAAERLMTLGGGTVLARDISDKKAEGIYDQGMRLGLKGLFCEMRDARRCDLMLREVADIVIADLPCSGLGVIGRKPDIKWKTEFEDIVALAKIQREILLAAAPCVRPGGYLCYSTCTLTKEENADNVALLQKLGFSLTPITNRLSEKLSGEKTEQGILELVPGIYETDGFFAALLQKEEDIDED